MQFEFVDFVFKNFSRIFFLFACMHSFLTIKWCLCDCVYLCMVFNRYLFCLPAQTLYFDILFYIISVFVFVFVSLYVLLKNWIFIFLGIKFERKKMKNIFDCYRIPLQNDFPYGKRKTRKNNKQKHRTHLSLV